ncbi:MAG TPA: IS66 family insertion sequence element accessory protein TnpB [Mobilitalea sp.]|nr:IS66 family insertion sequence element accessory protein TnpB [Mobilitalea sp.]
MDKVTLTKAEFRLRQWTKIIQDCQSSNLTVTEWCNQNNIGTKSYYYWLRKLRLKTCEGTGLPLPSMKQAIVPLQLSTFQSTPANPAVTIHIGSASIDIVEGTSQSMIEAVLKSLRNVC